MSTNDAGAITVCRASEVEPGTPMRVVVGELPPLVVFNLEGEFFVIEDTCTHGKASLAEGYVEGDEVECPWHGGRFCIRDGKPKGFPVVEAVRAYRATVVGDDVRISTEPIEE